MTRQPPRVVPFVVILLGAACGPAPVGPRAVPDPPDQPVLPDADVPPPPDVPDAEFRPKLPAPDARAVPASDAGVAAADASADATAPDAGVEAGSARSPTAGEVLIVEVLVNPAGQDAGREWIEIVSRAAEPVDLSQLHVADASIDAAAPAGIVDAGGRIVLGQSAAASTNGGAPVAVAYGTKLALNNDGEEISICIGACAGGTVIDRVQWKTLGAGYDGHALVLDRDANLTCAATQPFGTAGDFGTPGAANDGCAAPDAGP